MGRATYSFKDVSVAISGPNGTFNLGNGAGPSEEGITITMADAKGSMLIGADGSGMHSLHAGQAGKVTVRFLKTSPVNAMLSAMYRADTASSAVYGDNVITIRDIVRGDVIQCSQCGFEKHPDLTYAKEGQTVEWAWNSINIQSILGTGQPSAL